MIRIPENFYIERPSKLAFLGIRNRQNSGMQKFSVTLSFQV